MYILQSPILSLQNIVITPPITQVCVNCIGDNCANECRPVSGNNPFRINNIVHGVNYTISVSLRNDFGQSGESDPELYGEGETVLLWTYTCIMVYVYAMLLLLSDCDTMLH